jgi:hypothetical protein
MLEYFTYKKVKKHKADKAAKQEAKEEAEAARRADSSSGAADMRHAQHHEHEHDHHSRHNHEAVIRPDDESFLEELLASDDLPAPPLPPRLYSRELDWPSDIEDGVTPSTSQLDAAPPVDKGKAKETDKDKQGEQEAKKQNRFSAFFTRSKPKDDRLKPQPGTSSAEQEKEKKDLSRVLDRLNLSVKNNKIISTDSSAALQSFTNVFKDLVNGVPTAYDDLMKIIDDKDGALAKGFDKLPSSLKKLVTQLPDKITSSLGPELIAAAAASQGIKADKTHGLKGTAKSVLMPANLAQLVTKPGAIVGMLKAIVQVLKTRFPAFIGLNVLWGVALSRMFSPPHFVLAAA